ncbi:hypothetical protein EST38_g13507 [Candolleomyces aberdarensis]|uniref:Uncharacterized protein n=1 Tax=Candolleomyces aberdarensis TaxID=2316362 RepID=A0A4Q2CZS7_9AGAR|nr:hypothetical protein EST38_g13507 [Candolleomyces aberdarensis]
MLADLDLAGMMLAAAGKPFADEGFLFQMSSFVVNNLSIVPVFDGSNYSKWSLTMRSYLQYQSLWQVVSGSWALPELLQDQRAIAADSEQGISARSAATYTTDQKQANSDERRRWHETRDSAIGALKLRIKDSLHIYVDDESAKATWEALKNKYRKTSLSLKFSWFMELMRFQLPGTSSPHKELGRFDDLFAKLKKAEIEPSDEVLSMLIIMKLPDAYRTIMPLLVRVINADNLKLEDTKGYLLTEWERKQHPASKPMANRISAVKHKKGSPQFHQQQQKGRYPSVPPQQRAEFVPQQQQKGQKKRQRSGHGGGKPLFKGKGKARAHAADYSDTEPEEFGEDDRLFASLASEELTRQATIGLAASIIEDNPDFHYPDVADQAGPSKCTPSSSSAADSKSPEEFPISQSPTSDPTQLELNSLSITPAVKEKIMRTNGRMTVRGPRLSHVSYNKVPQIPLVNTRKQKGTETPIVNKLHIKEFTWGNEPFPGFEVGKGKEFPPRVSLPTPQLRRSDNPTPVRPSRPPPPAPKKHTVTLITGSGVVSRIEQEVPVQKRPTPPSIYSAVESARRTASGLGVQKTAQTMKNLEIGAHGREKTRSRVRAAKIGTKSYNARRVFYQQNKDKVKKRATELQKEGDGPWPIGTTAKALTELYTTLPKEEVEKLQTIANEWNTMGPGEEVHLDTAIKAIPKRSLAFFEDCRKQYGAVFFVLYAHKTSKGVQAGMMDYTRNMAGDGRSFSSKMKAEIADSGVQEIWEEYVNANWGVMEAEEEAGVRRRMGKSRKTMHLPVNEWGEPILPDVDLVAESGELPAEFSGLREYLQTMLRTFLSMHWGLAGPVTSKEPMVPWRNIIKEPRQYIRSKYLPDNLVGFLKDPSKTEK